MTTPPKWVRKGEPGHVEVTGTVGKLLRVNVYASDGGLLHSDRLPVDSRTGGPRGYALQGPPEAPKPRKTHEWGSAVRVDGERFGHRCARCQLERQEQGAGGYFMFRRPGGAWEALRRVPKCEVVP